MSRSDSDAPRKRSISGSASASSSLCRSTMQPTATTAVALPCDFMRPAATIASIDSALAASMKPQVLTMISSASAESSTWVPPWSTSCAR